MLSVEKLAGRPGEALRQGAPAGGAEDQAELLSQSEQMGQSFERGGWLLGLRPRELAGKLGEFIDVENPSWRAPPGAP